MNYIGTLYGEVSGTFIHVMYRVIDEKPFTV